MSTQASIFPLIPFSLTTPEQNFRLLELPPDLLDLLTSDGRPAILDLKSSAPSNEKPGTKSASEYLHLCTDTKSWAVRQVSTSNSVYITFPLPNQTSTDPSCSSSGITAISKPTSHLELIATNPSTNEINAAVEHLLPICSSADSYASLPPSSTLNDLINSLPYPRSLITPTLHSLIAFPTTPSNQLYIPSPTLLLESWKLFTSAAAEIGLRINGTDTFDFRAVAENIAIDEGTDGAGAIYRVIIETICTTFRNTSNHVANSQEMSAQEMTESLLEGPLNPEPLTILLGQLLVKCAGAKGIEKTQLLDEWSKLVPTVWEKHCDMSMLGEGYKTFEEEGKQMVWYASSSASRDSVPSLSTNAATTTGKRKWHEKFAAQRNKK